MVFGNLINLQIVYLFGETGKPKTVYKQSRAKFFV